MCSGRCLPFISRDVTMGRRSATLTVNLAGRFLIIN
ncbi:Protein kinase domain-containing protein [Psidium guajava]|nr:Protein kinase domain-containing protein [Psidium guajava]